MLALVYVYICVLAALVGDRINGILALEFLLDSKRKRGEHAIGIEREKKGVGPVCPARSGKRALAFGRTWAGTAGARTREIARPTHAAENHANLTEDPREECVDRRTRGAVAVDVPAGRLARARLSRRPAVVVAAHW